MCGKFEDISAFYIVKKLGIPDSMLKKASLEIYGEEYNLMLPSEENDELLKLSAEKIRKKRKVHHPQEADKIQLSDSVFVLPDRKLRHQMERKFTQGVMY